MRRSRTCDNPAPECGGSCGPGDSSETAVCHEGIECEFCTEENEILVNDPICERTCLTRDMPDVDCTPEMMVTENCTCAENYVRDDDGTCIHESECGCYDENGNLYPEGRFYLNDDECTQYECVDGDLQTYPPTCMTFCGPGYEYDEDTINPLNPCCGSCVTTERPGQECTLRESAETLTIRRPDGTMCATPTDVMLSYCRGTCDNTDAENRGDIRFEGVEMQPIMSSCECCSGTGNYENIQFICEGEPVTMQVKQMSSCDCEVCGGPVDSNEIWEAIPPPETEIPDAIPDLGGLFGANPAATGNTGGTSNTGGGGVPGGFSNFNFFG